METNHRKRPASQDEITLYCYIGEALCSIQHLEEALSHSITIKKDVKGPHTTIIEEANRILNGYRAYTLGQAIKYSQKENIYTEDLQGTLERFVIDRNWLVHKCIAEMYETADKNKWFLKVKAVSENANRLQFAIESDLMDFCTSKGMDMSKIREARENYYKNTMKG